MPGGLLYVFELGAVLEHRSKVGLPPGNARRAAAGAPELRPHVTVQEAIGDLPDAAEYGECGIYNHEPTRHTPDMVDRLTRLRVPVEPGSGCAALPN